MYVSMRQTKAFQWHKNKVATWSNTHYYYGASSEGHKEAGETAKGPLSIHATF